MSYVGAGPVKDLAVRLTRRVHPTVLAGGASKILKNSRLGASGRMLGGTAALQPGLLQARYGIRLFHPKRFSRRAADLTHLQDGHQCEAAPIAAMAAAAPRALPVALPMPAVESAGRCFAALK